MAASVFGALAIIGLAAFFVAGPYFERLLLQQTMGRAQLFETTLDQTLQRFQHLPLILKDDPLIVGAFYGVGLDGVNRRLEAIADRAGIEAVYLMNADGLTIAASNHAAAQRFIGENYRFRPYFQDAMRGQRGAFFAIGATTRRPGYFIADGVRNSAGGIIGAVAVKIDLSPLTSTWARTGEIAFVSNADDVVVLSSDEALRYRVLNAIDPFRRDEIAAERQFADEPLALLDWREIEGGRVRLAGEIYQHVAIRVGDRGWRLNLLSALDRVYERTWLVAVGAIAALGALAGLSLALRSERMRAALVSAQSDRRALIAANAALRRTQEELERSSKLVALGQLAASVTHELGQPISALKNYLAAAELKDSGDALIGPVARIVVRMEAITRQLRFFASPASEPMKRLDLCDVARSALDLVRHDAEAAGVATRLRLDGPAYVMGDALRLEQVVVNLTRNAIAAIAGASRRELEISATVEAATVVLSVADTGCGIGGRTLDQLAEPFHSTRESGQGMGLGLAISVEIVREHKGTLSVAGRDKGGTVFSMSLPQAEDPNVRE